MLLKPQFAIVAGLVAFAAGLATGVLFAPASGEKTRRRLVRRGEQLADKAGDVTESVKGSATDLVDRARRRIA
jgi:gas vesicle protein